MHSCFEDDLNPDFCTSRFELRFFFAVGVLKILEPILEIVCRRTPLGSLLNIDNNELDSICEAWTRIRIVVCRMWIIRWVPFWMLWPRAHYFKYAVVFDTRVLLWGSGARGTKRNQTECCYLWHLLGSLMFRMKRRVVLTSWKMPCMFDVLRRCLDIVGRRHRTNEIQHRGSTTRLGNMLAWS